MSEEQTATRHAPGRSEPKAAAFQLFDGLREGICLLNAEGSLLYANESARRLLALDGREENLAEIADADGFLPEQTWRSLVADAPATAHAHTTSGPLLVESRPAQWQDEPVVQLVINRAAETGETSGVEAQLTALARISRELNATLHLDDILDSVLQEAVQHTEANGGQISLFEADGSLQQRLVQGIVAPTPEQDRRVIETQQSAILSTLPNENGPTEVRSALIAPILFGGEVAGLIHLFADRRDFFTPQTETFITTLSNYAAIAIGNARRFAEIKERNTLLQQRTQQIEHFVESSRVFNSDRPLEEVYEDLVYAIQEGVGFNVVLLSLAEREGTDWSLRKVMAAGLPLEQLQELQQVQEPWQKIERLMKPEHALGNAFFVPAGEANGDLAITKAADLFPTGDGEQANAWRDHDLFFIPMRDSRGQPLALINLAAPLDGARPDLNTARVLEIFANQAANAIENVQLFHNMRDYAIELQQLHNVSQQTLREPDFDGKLQWIVDGLQTAGWGRVALTLRDEEFNATKLVTGGMTAEEHDYLANNLLPGELWQTRFRSDDFQKYRRGSSYLIPHDADEAQENVQPDAAPPDDEEAGDANRWHPHDALVRPLYDQQGQPLALISLDQPQDGRRPSERALQTIDLYAQFATSVIVNHRLFSEMVQRSEELQTLVDASRALSGTLDEDAVLTAMGEHMLQAIDAHAYTIYALRRDKEDAVVLNNRLQIAGEDGAPSGPLYDGNRLELARQVIDDQEPATRYISSPQKAGETAADAIPQESHAVAMLPLTIGEELYGIVEVVCVGERNRLTEDKLKLLGAILNQSSTALETVHLFEELDERVARRTQALAEESERVKILLRITTELTTSLDKDVVLARALQLVNDVVKASQGVIMLVDEESDELVIQAAEGLERDVPVEGLRSGMKRNEGLAGWVIEKREAAVIEDATQDERWVGEAFGEQRSLLAAPLITGNDVLGVIMLTHPDRDRFTGEQLSLVEAAASQVANAVHNASLYDLIRQQAEKLGAMMREAQIEVAKVQSILESIADGVLVAEADGEIIMANMPTAKILDMPQENLIGKTVHELMGLYGESGDEWVKTIETWAAQADSLERRTSLKNQLEIDDKIVLVHVAPVFANNNYFGTISIFRDVTKEVEVDRMKSEFVSTVSHELRTPMTSIKGYADLMLMGAAGELTPPQLRYLEVIKNNADRLKALVNDLLDISRIETGKTQLKLQPVDISQLVSDVVNDHMQGRIQHEKIDIKVMTSIAPSLPLANADPDKVTRILTNLVDNALNYTPAGGEVEIEAQANGDYVSISVRDTGIGISEENQAKVFDRFYRVEESEVQDIPGTGLGLSIVSSLVEMHGGEMSLTSRLGEGSTFTFSLPLVVDDSDMV
ncbi:MAG: GAF domain-containing protein [Candidatus Promineifilaceae bacterium]|nr:GAF domain-containing protein [Candidatus Promineifilaceae bacterium]